MTQPKNRTISLLGVPLDLGGNRRGVDMGPSAVRMTNLAANLRNLGCELRDRGDVHVPLPEEIPAPGDPRQKFADQIGSVCDKVCEAVYQIHKDGQVPLSIGGDHSIAMGTVAGTAKYYHERNQQIGVLWVDAHGDMNTPESTNSGNVHGMPLAHLLGMGNPRLAQIGGYAPKIHPWNTVLLGIRDLDEREKNLITGAKVATITMRDIDRDGIAKCLDEALKVLLHGTAGIHVSFDMDVVDPALAPGVGTPKKGGLDYREAHFTMEAVADCGKLLALDIVEINPILDTRNSTAELAEELILSALGKRIF